MAAPIRRVVARAGADGATVVDDAPATAVMELPAVPGTALTDLWRSDVVPVPAPDGTDPTAADFALMPSGSLFRIIDLAPTGDAEPMWHQTDSLDCIYLASGEATFLADGAEVTLHAGDSIVVGGVRHAWVNRGNDVCRLVNVSITLGAAEG